MAQGAASSGARKSDRHALQCTNRPERQAYKMGFCRVAGLDEAGRGCLFGPVYAGAVILNPARPIRGLRDSKQLTAVERQVLAGKIRETALAWSVAWADNGEIDRLNIYQASRLAMKRALEGLSPRPDYLLVDALSLDTTIQQKSLIHGDALSRSIAAASILAKVDRDESMRDWDRMYPQYGFLHHKGYCTREHLRALAEHGVTAHHRFSYEPVREAAGGSGQLSLFGQAGLEEWLEEAGASWT
ncbi:MAG: ribonuclease HII [Acidobacteriia bacterium]|nr:ribonuclease HII [Terriglobia bacterium]